MEGYYLERILRVAGYVVMAVILAGLIVATVAIVRWARARRRRRPTVAAPGGRPSGTRPAASRPPVGRTVAPPRTDAPRRTVAPPRADAPRGSTTGDGERGAGTVLVLGVAAVAIVLALGLAAIGAAQQTRGGAQSAADLGALAAATALRHGLDPCAVATETVERNHAQLGTCAPEGGGVVGLTATKALPALRSWPGGQAEARARAGPRPLGSG